MKPWGLKDFVRGWDREGLRLAHALQACAAWMALAEHHQALEGEVPREVVQRLAAERRALLCVVRTMGLGSGRLAMDGGLWDLMAPDAWHLGYLMEQEWVRWQRGRTRRTPRPARLERGEALDAHELAIWEALCSLRRHQQGGNERE